MQTTICLILQLSMFVSWYLWRYRDCCTISECYSHAILISCILLYNVMTPSILRYSQTFKGEKLWFYNIVMLVIFNYTCFVTNSFHYHFYNGIISFQLLDNTCSHISHGTILLIKLFLDSFNQRVMEEFELGPNGGLVYCMEYLLANFSWLEDRLNALGSQYVLFDCPGQVSA